MIEGRLVYEDSKVEIRCDTDEMEGYILYFKKTESYMLIKRGTLEYIGRADEYNARIVLEKLVKGFKGCKLINIGEDEISPSTIISAIKKAYVLEKKN